MAHNPLFYALVLVGTALLLVSTLPVWSFKNFKVRAEYVLPLMLGTGTFAAVLVADPWGGARRGRTDLSRDAPVQRPQLPALAGRGRTAARGGAGGQGRSRSRPVTIGCTVLATDGAARAGVLHTAHGEVRDAGLHAGRHRRHGEGDDRGRGARDRRAASCSATPTT